MTERHAARAAAVVIAAAVIVVTSFSVLVWVAGGMRPLPVTFGRSAAGVVGVVAAPMVYAAVGGILASRLPRNPIGWLFLAAAVAIGSMLPVNLLVSASLESLRPASPTVVWVAWARAVFAVPVMLTVLIAAALLFPNGRLISRRWRWAMAGAVAGGLLLAFVTAADPQGLAPYPAIPNPTALPYAWSPSIEVLQLVALAVVIPSIAAAAVSVGVRYRRGDEVVRAQLRWIVLGVAIAAVGVLPYLVIRFVVPVGNDLGDVLAAVAQIGACAFPIAAAFAISRHQLFDIDVLIGRTLVYLPLTALLGGLYTAGIALFQRVFVAMTGETSDVAIVLAMLLVATAFTPLRRWLESVVERRFPALAEPASPNRGVAGRVDPAKPDGPDGREAPAQARSAGGFLAADLLDVGHTAESVEVLPMSLGATVVCPLGPARTVYDCLGCSYFRAIARHPPAVICGAPADGKPPHGVS
jgi:hypothetical protein